MPPNTPLPALSPDELFKSALWQVANTCSDVLHFLQRHISMYALLPDLLNSLPFTTRKDQIGN